MARFRLDSTPRPKKAMAPWLWYAILGVAVAIIVAGIIVTYAVGGHLF
ncbi:hypothetical protein GCM10022286_25580 [Gryllotalpicola daejeonensis]|uniref:Uncharacterized protein n=1 Tax=Gryllotalpicola daejeonensis TaxID=993087 RepID=A0ABP7ZM94_9MICO